MNSLSVVVSIFLGVITGFYLAWPVEILVILVFFCISFFLTSSQGSKTKGSTSWVNGQATLLCSALLSATFTIGILVGNLLVQ